MSRAKGTEAKGGGVTEEGKSLNQRESKLARSQLFGSLPQPAIPLDHRWWRFFLIAGLNIVVGSYNKKQEESVAAEPRKIWGYERGMRRVRVG